MIARAISPITPTPILHIRGPGGQPGQANARVFVSAEIALEARPRVGRPRVRVLIRPEPGFYVMRLRSGAPLVSAVIYQLCPMVIPQPLSVAGPHPDDWCRPLDRSPRFEARLDGKPVDIDRVWTTRSLRRVSHTEFDFRSGPLQRWARENPSAPEARPHRPVDLGAMPPLF